MKFLTTQKRVNTEDSLGLGIEVALVMALFFAVGYGLDRLFGTMPIFMIIMTLLSAVGLFTKFKYRYDERMDEHEAKRVSDIAKRETR